MRVHITKGNNVPPWHHVTVDNVGALVDLTKSWGIAMDPLVVEIVWDDTLLQRPGAFPGVIRRSQDGQTSEEQFADFGRIQQFVDAHRARIAELG